MVVSQDPRVAKFDGMPSGGIETGLADYILPLEEAPDQLMKYTSPIGKGVLLDTAITDVKSPDAFQNGMTLTKPQ
jgi:hypothetical protein